MKTITTLSVVAAALTLLPSCSLESRWGSATPRFRVLNEQRYDLGGREFVTRRYLVNENPLETFVETLEIGAPWAAGAGRAAGGLPLVQNRTESI